MIKTRGAELRRGAGESEEQPKAVEEPSPGAASFGEYMASEKKATENLHIYRKYREQILRQSESQERPLEGSAIEETKRARSGEEDELEECMKLTESE